MTLGTITKRKKNENGIIIKKKLLKLLITIDNLLRVKKDKKGIFPKEIDRNKT